MQAQVTLQTRWLQKIDSLHIFVELLDSIVKSFNEMTCNPLMWMSDSLVDAMSLTQAILCFAGEGCKHIVQAAEHVSTLKNVLSDARSHACRCTISCYV